MGNCKQFIDGVRQINFTEESAFAVHQALLTSAHHALAREIRPCSLFRPLMAETMNKAQVNIKSNDAMY